MRSSPSIFAHGYEAAARQWCWWRLTKVRWMGSDASQWPLVYDGCEDWRFLTRRRSELELEPAVMLRLEGWLWRSVEGDGMWRWWPKRSGYWVRWWRSVERLIFLGGGLRWPEGDPDRKVDEEAQIFGWGPCRIRLWPSRMLQIWWQLGQRPCLWVGHGLWWPSLSKVAGGEHTWGE